MQIGRIDKVDSSGDAIVTLVSGDITNTFRINLDRMQGLLQAYSHQQSTKFRAEAGKFFAKGASTGK